jgi:hypothetical protein
VVFDKESGGLRVSKVPSPTNPAQGVVEGVRRLGPDVDFFSQHLGSPPQT